MNPDSIEINGEIAYKYINNNNYYITETGNLYSIYVVGGQGKTDINKIHKVAYGQDRDGYYRVILSNNRERKYIKIHQIVVNQFLGGCPNNMVVNHKDGNKKNNNLSNLEVVTTKENTIHAWSIGLISKQNHPGYIKVSIFDKKNNQQYCFPAIEEAHRFFPELSKSYISHIRKKDINFNLCLFKKIVNGDNTKNYYIECYYNGQLYKTFSDTKEAGDYFGKNGHTVHSAFFSKYPIKINNYIITFPNVSTIESVALNKCE